MLIIMKNIIISGNNKDGCPKSKQNHLRTKLDNAIEYFHQIIQKTIISIQKYQVLLKQKNNIEKVTINLDNIRNELINIFRLYGTENIHDLLNICYGDEYVSNIEWDNNKYNLLEKYFHPINFKIIPWKSERQFTHKNIEKNKIIEDFSIVENADNLECFDLSRSSKTFQTKVYGIKIAIHNKVERKTIIVSGLIDDILISCVNNEYILKKLEGLILSSVQQPEYDVNVFQRFIQSITLKELIVYSIDELNHKYQGHMNQVLLIKEKSISQVVKEFMNSDLYGQRNTLIQLLLKSDDNEYQYLAYLLYDILSTDVNGSIDTSEQTLLFDSLPWKTKNFFKDAMNQTINYTNNLANFDNSKIPLEQQICLMKADDSIKEKAMNKLKEIKSKTDDTGSKARTYLDGLLKIPFGIFKKEPVLNIMSTMKDVFKQLIDKIKLIDDKFGIDIDIDIENITNIQIKNLCEVVKEKYVKNKNVKLIEILINNYTPDKRNDLIVNICNINNHAGDMEP